MLINNKLFVIAIVVAVLIIFLIIYRHHQRKLNADFDDQPRDRNGEVFEDDDEIEELPPLREQGAIFGDEDNPWNTFTDFIDEIGIVDIKNGIIEYESVEGKRKFVMLAEQRKSNPLLKSAAENMQSLSYRELFYNSLSGPFKQSAQRRKINMKEFNSEQRKRVAEISPSDNKRDTVVRTYAQSLLDESQAYEDENTRFESMIILQFATFVPEDEVYGETREEIEKMVQDRALRDLATQIGHASSIMKKAGQPVIAMDTFGALEALYTSWHPNISVKVRFDDIVRSQRFVEFITARQDDIQYESVLNMIEHEQLVRRRVEAELQKENGKVV